MEKEIFMNQRTHLDVGLWECDHLGQNVHHMQILHLVPFATSLYRETENVRVTNFAFFSIDIDACTYKSAIFWMW